MLPESLRNIGICTHIDAPQVSMEILNILAMADQFSRSRFQSQDEHLPRSCVPDSGHQCLTRGASGCYRCSVPSKTAPEPVYAEIGRRIEHFRLERRISQGELGRRLRHPLTRAAVSNMEGGRQRVLVHVLLEIAEVLRIEPSRLLPVPARRDEAPSVDAIAAQLRANGITDSVAVQIAQLSAGSRK
jgi:transcriptional regulator with XRE-family HTH domain